MLIGSRHDEANPSFSLRKFQMMAGKVKGVGGWKGFARNVWFFGFENKTKSV